METVSLHRILLVEDHADTAAALGRVLAKAGYRVTVADSAESALTVADQQTFDLVVSDLGLPEMNGFEMMQRLAERFGLKGIAISGYDSSEETSRARAAGFVELLVKPVNFAQLRSALERHFQSR